MRRIPRKAVEIGKGHGPLPAGAANLDRRIERNQCDREVGRMGGNAVLARPSTACQRFSAPIAAQPEPGSRLLQAA